jgi:GNAT superfamily N-acetyltransferase
VIFLFAPTVAAEAEMINGWRWPNVYPDRPGLRFGDPSFTARDEDGTVVGYCTFGELSGFDREHYVAVAAGIHPDLVGGGHGRALMAAVLDLGRREFSKQNLVGIVKNSNARSLKSVLGAGFVILRDADDGEGVIVLDGRSELASGQRAGTH